MVTTGSDTWGVSGPDFLTYYAAAGALAALGVWLCLRHLLGPRHESTGGSELDGYDLALLTGGSGLAITIASARLHLDGLVRPGGRRRTLLADVGTAGGADPLERDVLEAARRRPGISSSTLRDELEDRPGIAHRRAKLAEAGLLVDPSSALRARALSLPFAALAAVGGARLAAGLANGRPVTFLAVLVAAVTIAAVRLALRPPSATATGRAEIAWRREHRPDLRTAAGPSDLPMAMALFGAAALWGGDPAFAEAWSIPHTSAGGGGGGGDGGGGGCGGCGGCGG